MRTTPEIVSVEPTGEYRLFLRFADGCEGEVDLSDVAGSGVFAAWRDMAEFRKVTIDAEAGTLVWRPDGLDVAPDRLYEEALQHSTAPCVRDRGTS